MRFPDSRFTFTVIATLLLVSTPVVQSAYAKSKFKVLHSFNGLDGAYPTGALIRDSAGDFYGVTNEGGISKACTNGCGTVFKLLQSGVETVRYSFTGKKHGNYPASGMSPVQDAAGNIYGTTFDGGDLTTCDGLGCGIVFKVDKKGKETILHTFGKDKDGSQPGSGVVRDSNGNLYGTTESGGANNGGTVYEIDGSGHYSVLYSFAFGGGTDGSVPYGGLLRDATGNLYGTTFYGGGGCAFGCGTVFEIDHDNNETILYRFTDGSDGAFPVAGLLRDNAGNLYGTASAGGNSECFNGEGCGVVFKLDTNNVETVLYTFTGGADGRDPSSVLVRDHAGNLFGATTNGGEAGMGVVFKVSPNGKETVLHSFSGGSDGSFPGDLLRDSLGNLYGLAAGGGNAACQDGCGTVFKIDPSTH
jgi:uncharacterized repeat protein (TIGR03803 family)